jgi:hypothetical protein
MSPTNLTLVELRLLGHTGLLAGDWLLPWVMSPACWLAAILISVAWPSYSRGALAWFVRASGTLLLAGAVLGGLLMLPVNPAWAVANGPMASKAARHMNWSNTEPKTFSRLNALKLHLAIQDEALVADKVVDTLVKAGASRTAAESVVMRAMAKTHRQNKH